MGKKKHNLYQKGGNNINFTKKTLKCFMRFVYYKIRFCTETVFTALCGFKKRKKERKQIVAMAKKPQQQQNKNW